MRCHGRASRDDCRAVEAVDLIITDHHEFDPEQLPGCHTIVHPRLRQETPYENGHLCGAGVAFKLAWAIGTAVSGQREGERSMFRAFLLDATALAALGTIADVVPLVGENRVLAHFGLGGLKASKLTGIRALIEAAGLSGQTLDSYHVGFLLGPRLNAAGRMGHASLAVEMLTTATEERAIEIAEYLETKNRERQAMEARHPRRCSGTSRIADIAAMRRCPRSWSASAGWHAGVIGIVASRLVDRYHKPAIVVSLNDELGQGSGRSISGFHLASGHYAPARTHLVGHGGHEMAAGLKVEPAKFPAFRQSFLDHAAQDDHAGDARARVAIGRVGGVYRN